MRDVIARQRDAKGDPIWRGKPGGLQTTPGSRPGVQPNGRAKPSGTGGRTPGVKPDGRARTTDGSPGETVRGRGGQRPQGGDAPETKGTERDRPRWWRPPADAPPSGDRGGSGDKSKDPPRAQPKEQPREQPREQPKQQPPPKQDGGYKQPPSNPPPSNPPPRWNPPVSRPSPPRGGGSGSGKGGSG